MKNFLLIIILVFSVASCKNIKEVPVKTETVITERLVPISIPADSAVVSMLFSCDSLNRVLLTKYSEQKTANVSTELKSNNNAVEIKFKNNPDTVFKVIRDTNSYKEIPIIIKTEKKVNVLKFWQKGLMLIGVIALVLLALQFILNKK